MTSLPQSLVTNPALDFRADRFACADCQLSYVIDRFVVRPVTSAHITTIDDCASTKNLELKCWKTLPLDGSK
jgi:hypothetical protein